MALKTLIAAAVVLSGRATAGSGVTVGRKVGVTPSVEVTHDSALIDDFAGVVGPKAETTAREKTGAQNMKITPAGAPAEDVARLVGPRVATARKETSVPKMEVTPDGTFIEDVAGFVEPKAGIHARKETGAAKMEVTPAGALTEDVARLATARKETDPPKMDVKPNAALTEDVARLVGPKAVIHARKETGAAKIELTSRGALTEKVVGLVGTTARKETGGTKIVFDGVRIDHFVKLVMVVVVIGLCTVGIVCRRGTECSTPSPARVNKWPLRRSSKTGLMASSASLKLAAAPYPSSNSTCRRAPTRTTG